MLEFFICWTPLYVVNTVSFFAPNAVYQGLGYTAISMFQLLSHSSCCCNPITYCFMSSSFRRAFLRAFGCAKNDNVARSIGTVWNLTLNDVELIATVVLLYSFIYKMFKIIPYKTILSYIEFGKLYGDLTAVRKNWLIHFVINIDFCDFSFWRNVCILFEFYFFIVAIFWLLQSSDWFHKESFSNGAESKRLWCFILATYVQLSRTLRIDMNQD